MRGTVVLARRAETWSGRLSRRRMLEILSVSATGGVLTACGASGTGTRSGPMAGSDEGREAVDFSARFAAFEPADEPNGDLSKVVWPDFVTQADPEIKRLYAFQIEHGELMRYMPCFCGCGESDGHRNNRDCYVQAVNPDGSVVLDSMAPT